jgi:hypothetical protein
MNIRHVNRLFLLWIALGLALLPLMPETRFGSPSVALVLLPMASLILFNVRRMTALAFSGPS